MNLKTYLKDHNMTQKQFAFRIDCTREYISMICRGKAIPSKLMAVEIYKATHGQVTVEELIELRIKRKKERQQKKEESRLK